MLLPKISLAKINYTFFCIHMRVLTQISHIKYQLILHVWNSHASNSASFTRPNTLTHHRKVFDSLCTLLVMHAATSPCRMASLQRSVLHSMGAARSWS
jgi:hypothetical protein